ncbi:UPF0389 protein CG9231 [Augochlora pura]
MFSVRLLKRFIMPIRQINTMPAKRNKLPSSDQVSKPQTAPTTPGSEPAKKLNPEDLHVIGADMHYVSNFDRRVLVWVKKYPSVDRVPRLVPWSTMQRANTTARIRVCYVMMVVSVIGFVYAVVSGKREASSGRHIIGERMKWVEEQRLKGIAEAKAKAEAEAAAAAQK